MSLEVTNEGCMQPLIQFHNDGAARFGDCCFGKMITIQPDNCAVIKIVKFVTTIFLTAIANLLGKAYDWCKGNPPEVKVLTGNDDGANPPPVITETPEETPPQPVITETPTPVTETPTPPVIPPAPIPTAPTSVSTALVPVGAPRVTLTEEQRFFIQNVRNILLRGGILPTVDANTSLVPFTAKGSQSSIHLELVEENDKLIPLPQISFTPEMQQVLRQVFRASIPPSIDLRQPRSIRQCIQLLDLTGVLSPVVVQHNGNAVPQIVSFDPGERPGAALPPRVPEEVISSSSLRDYIASAGRTIGDVARVAGWVGLNVFAAALLHNGAVGVAAAAGAGGVSTTAGAAAQGVSALGSVVAVLVGSQTLRSL